MRSLPSYADADAISFALSLFLSFAARGSEAHFLRKVKPSPHSLFSSLLSLPLSFSFSFENSFHGLRPIHHHGSLLGQSVGRTDGRTRTLPDCQLILVRGRPSSLAAWLQNRGCYSCWIPHNGARSLSLTTKRRKLSIRSMLGNRQASSWESFEI